MRRMGRILIILYVQQRIMMRRAWLMAGIFLLFAVIQVVEAKRISVTPVTDTYVDNTLPNTYFGYYNTLDVSKVQECTQLAYLMFDLSAIPPPAEIFSAKLYLRPYSWASYHPRVFRALGTVSESMTWNTKLEYSADWYAEAQEESGYVCWDVKEAVKNRPPSGYLSFCLAYPFVGYSEVFYSRESAYAPFLDIEYNTPPSIDNYSFSPSSGEWGTTFNFSLRASDPDGDILDVTLILDGQSFTMNWVAPNLYRYSWTSAAGDIGTKSFRFLVSDGKTAQTVGPFSLKVEKKSTSVSLWASSSEVRLGSTLRLEGSVNPPLTGVAVILRLVGPYNVTQEKLTFTQDGRFNFLLENFTKNDLGQWKAVAEFGGNEYYKGSMSREVVFYVKKATSYISAKISENVVRGDKKVTISGTLNPPGKAGELVTISFQVGGYRFEEETTTGPGGGFSFRFEPSELAEKHRVPERTGEWRVTASWRGSEAYEKSEYSLYFRVLSPLWVEQWFLPASALGIGLLGGLTIAVVRARKTYAPTPPSKSRERLVFEVRE
jgi:hypothetical protein